MIISLPWPPANLRPNAHKHWRSRHGASQSYKANCLILCRQAGLQDAEPAERHMTLRFCPPDRRRRDMDNMLGQSKWLIDAVAETIGIDDYNFNFTLVRGDPVKGGCVEVTLS